MGKQQSQDQQFEGIDEHDLPTEPGRPILPPIDDATDPGGNNPYIPQPSYGYPDTYNNGNPAPQQIHLPAYPDPPQPQYSYPVPPPQYQGPRQQYPAGAAYQAQPQPYPYPAYPQSPQTPKGGAPRGAYPYLPPATERGKRRKGKGGESDEVQAQPVPQRTPRARSGGLRFRTSAIPGLVKLFLGLLQIVLLVRFASKLLGVPATAYSWVGPVYSISDVFIQPVHQFLLQVRLPFQLPLEVYTLAAIIFYWLLSRVLVGLLKALF